MDDTLGPDGVGTSLNDVVHSLNDLRDNLVSLSLLLKDYRFEMDETARREAAAAVSVLLSKAQGPEASHPQPTSRLRFCGNAPWSPR